MTAWDPRAVIAAKRDGRTLPPEEVERFVSGYGRGEIGDGPAAAFLMAVVLNGMDADETLAMTRAMIASGDTVRFDGVEPPTVDKHSTGGVADSVTLVFAPLAAALGLAVAKLSGRGLGHTGGTLDKLESIPGLRTDLTPEDIERQVMQVGCAVGAQSTTLVPADGAMYALRDATATVPAVPLIAASVMSKKLAVATDLILLDVKAGSGAFMKDLDDARLLADACRALADRAGRRAGVAVTDMSQPLGDAIGNALDVAEAVAILRGAQRGRLRDLVLWFAARALEALDGVSFDVASERAEQALDSGRALERFARMVEAQGGDPRVVDDPGAVLPAAPVVLPIVAEADGTVAAVDAEALGLASSALGAGRVRKGDAIDPAVGIVVRPKVGDRVVRGERLGEVHGRSDTDAREAADRVRAAFSLSDGPVEAPALVHAWMGED
jgi:pyrimidine-nucleoside phosphorylase